MRALRLAVILGVVAVLVSSVLAFPDGDKEKGKALFHDPTFAGATTGRSCSSCHIEGRGLENTGGKEEWRIMGKRYKSLEGAVNYMIEKALHGKALDPGSEEMVDTVAYVKSL